MRTLITRITIIIESNIDRLECTLKANTKKPFDSFTNLFIKVLFDILLSIIIKHLLYSTLLRTL